MKRIVTLMTLTAVLCCAMPISAQEGRNQAYRITLGNVQYAHHDEKLSAGDAVGKILTGVLTGQTSVQGTERRQGHQGSH